MIIFAISNCFEGLSIQEFNFEYNSIDKYIEEKYDYIIKTLNNYGDECSHFYLIDEKNKKVEEKHLKLKELLSLKNQNSKMIKILSEIINKINSETITEKDILNLIEFSEVYIETLGE